MPVPLALTSDATDINARFKFGNKCDYSHLQELKINASGSMHPLVTFGNVSQNGVWWGVG